MRSCVEPTDPSASQSPRTARARSILDRYEEAGALGEFRCVEREAALSQGLHEWFSDTGHRVDLPPLSVLIGLAWRMLESRPGQRVIWIGRRCWPYPPALVRRGGSGPSDHLLRRSVYIDPRSRAELVWAAELAARSGGIGAVIADGRGLRMAESRRLHLAALHAGCPVVLARAAEEIGVLSAAGTRWRVRPCIDPGNTTSSQAWTAELLRNKSGMDALFGAPRPDGTARRWLVRRDHATGTIETRNARDGQTGDGDLAAEVVGRSAASTRSKIA